VATTNILLMIRAKQIFVCEMLISTMLNPCNANKATVTEVITKKKKKKKKTVSEAFVADFIIPLFLFFRKRQYPLHLPLTTMSKCNTFPNLYTSESTHGQQPHVTHKN
jgi:hypothetical protein